MNKSVFRSTLAVLLLAFAVRAAAAGVDVSEASDAGSIEPNHRYLVTTTHTPDQCLAALDEMGKKSTLSKMQWGCMSGDHTGSMIVSAADSDAALKMLPEASRPTAKAVEVSGWNLRQPWSTTRRSEAARSRSSPGRRRC